MDGQRELHDMLYIEADIAPHMTITEWRTRRLPAQRSRRRRLRKRVRGVFGRSTSLV